jgi:large subunit ribosomal protein L18
MSHSIKVVQFRRKREGKTDYKKRLNLLKGRTCRLVVRPSLKNISAQLVTFAPAGDLVEVGVNSSALAKHGWNVHKGNIPAAYLTGFLLGKLAASKGIKEAILDTGLYTPIKGGRIYACVKGIVDAGVAVPVDEVVLPSDERVKGSHIADYASKVGATFTDYKKNGVDPASLPALFDKVKASLEAQQ